jgi:hypothetical protein
MDRRMAQAREQSRRVLPSRLGLELLLGGLITGLLTLAGAALIDARPVIDPGPAVRCTAFQVGSPHAANTRIQLYNAGPTHMRVRLDFVDYDGLDSQDIGYNSTLDSAEYREFVFRTPALGAAVELVSWGGDVTASAEILRDDRAPAEVRTPASCPPRGTGRSDQPNAGGPQGAASMAPGRAVQA